MNELIKLILQNKGKESYLIAGHDVPAGKKTTLILSRNKADAVVQTASKLNIQVFIEGQAIDVKQALDPIAQLKAEISVLEAELAVTEQELVGANEAINALKLEIAQLKASVTPPAKTESVETEKAVKKTAKKKDKK